MSFVEKILSYINPSQIQTKQFIGLALFCSVLVFTPDEHLTHLRVLEIRNTYGSFIGLGLIFFTVFSLIASVENLVLPLIKTKETKENEKQIKQHLHTLSKNEKEILSASIENDENSIFGHGYVGNVSLLDRNSILEILLKKKLISRAGDSESNKYPCAAFIITPFAWSYLKKHPECLKEKTL